jgi:hypothetical protein
MCGTHIIMPEPTPPTTPATLDALDEVLVDVRRVLQRPGYRRRLLAAVGGPVELASLRVLRAVERSPCWPTGSSGPSSSGKLLSTAGIWIHNIVAAILAFQLTRSAFVVGLVSVAQFAPAAALRAAQRRHRRPRRPTRQLVLGRLIAAAGSGGLALWIALVGVDGLPGAAPVVGAALVVGIGFVVGGPAMHALLPTLVRPGELASAIALNSVPFTVARAGGPAHRRPGRRLGRASSPSRSPPGQPAFAGVMAWLPIGGPDVQEPTRTGRCGRDCATSRSTRPSCGCSPGSVRSASARTRPSR